MQPDFLVFPQCRGSVSGFANFPPLQRDVGRRFEYTDGRAVEDMCTLRPRETVMFED